MSNIIRLNATERKEKSLSMSNQGTDTFLELILLAASGQDMTANQKKLIDYLAERGEVNRIAPGTASFDVDEMPWNKSTLHEDVSFMMRVIASAEEPDVFGQLDYRPDMRIVTPWLRSFSQKINSLDKEYIYGPEEEAIVRSGIGGIYAVLHGSDSGAKKRLLFYLDRYLDPYYKNDLSSLYEPLKEMLQDVVITANEEDVIEEALHLLEAYVEPPFDVLEENLQRVPAQFLAWAEELVKTGIPEVCKIELTGSTKEQYR